MTILPPVISRSHLRFGCAALLRASSLVLTVVVALALVSMAGAQPGPSLTVVVTINPYADLVQQVAGDRADVVTLLPPGASPHAFDPTPSQAAQLAKADLILMNGGLDSWLNRLVDAVAPHTPVLVMMDAIDFVAREGHDHDDELHEPAGEHTEPDHDHEGDQEHDGHGQAMPAFANPHIWLDPVLAAEAVGAIASALAQVDPAGADMYAANAQGARQELLALHDRLADLLAPVAGAAFVPFHDAWVYFAARYDLHIVVTLEPFPGREPSPRYIAEAVQALRDSGAKAIFAERQLGRRSADVVAQSAGVQVAVLDPLGGAPGPITYEQLLLENARAIVAALAD